MAELNGWENFYVIVGSAAGALIGLQFVVITLIADRPRLQMGEASAAFATPTIIHFGIVLLLAAIACVPWQGCVAVSVLWVLIALSGLIYVIITGRRMRAQTIYQPELLDWAFHLMLPGAAYSMLAVAAGLVCSYSRSSAFVLGSAMVLLLFSGIHNAWDAVTYHLFERHEENK
jgi:hypothetical protein